MFNTNKENEIVNCINELEKMLLEVSYNTRKASTSQHTIYDCIDRLERRLNNIEERLILIELKIKRQEEKNVQ